jgi:hypothetical protein
MAETIIINSVSLVPNPVSMNEQFVISVEIYVLYPANSIYPSDELYPTPDTGALKSDRYIPYPSEWAFPHTELYPKN